MNLCSSKVFLCLFVGYSLFTIVTSFESGRVLHPALRQHAEFGEGVRDWFRGVKDKVRNFFKPTTTPAPIIEAESAKQAMNQFFLDLASTRFNADRDWGFRLGSWYFIKKVDFSDDGPTRQYIPTTTVGYNEFTSEHEEFITSTSSHPVSYNEEIETLEHEHHDFITSSTIHPYPVSDNIETLGHTDYSTYSTMTPEVITAEHSEPNKESGEEVDDVTIAPTTEVNDQPSRQDKDNEISVRAPQSAEVISPK